ncbi:hypothetical protein ACYZT3_01685 [Pseudomonas sp. MDT1-16]|nr:hypothetical protein [Pseudomonas sp. AL03]MDI3275782.1 hypothetical protein [Pseudomonas sp. AL03]
MRLTDNLKVLGSYTFIDIEYSKPMISTLNYRSPREFRRLAAASI